MANDTGIDKDHGVSFCLLEEFHYEVEHVGLHVRLNARLDRFQRDAKALGRYFGMDEIGGKRHVHGARL